VVVAERVAGFPCEGKKEEEHNYLRKDGSDEHFNWWSSQPEQKEF